MLASGAVSYVPVSRVVGNLRGKSDISRRRLEAGELVPGDPRPPDLRLLSAFLTEADLPDFPSGAALEKDFRPGGRAADACDWIWQRGRYAGHAAARTKSTSDFATLLKELTDGWVAKDAKARNVKTLAGELDGHELHGQTVSGITDSAVSQWRSGHRIPKPETLAVIIDFLGSPQDTAVALIERAARESPQDARWILLLYAMQLPVSDSKALFGRDPTTAEKMERWHGAVKRLWGKDVPGSIRGVDGAPHRR